MIAEDREMKINRPDTGFLNFNDWQTGDILKF
jgi:hypothetical protein